VIEKVNETEALYT